MPEDVKRYICIGPLKLAPDSPSTQTCLNTKFCYLSKYRNLCWNAVKDLFIIMIFKKFCFCSPAGFLHRLVRVFFGCLAAVSCGMLYAAYLSTYHDRKFWFSTRQVGDLCEEGFGWIDFLHLNHNSHCFTGVGAWNHLPRRQWALLLLLQAHADGILFWKRYHQFNI